MEQISGLITCCNSMPQIKDCLQSMTWVDELVVVDSFSTDGTPEVAREYADKFFQREYASPGDQKNWAIAQTSHPWILAIDSDEIVPDELRNEIKETLKEPRFNRYKVYRKNYFLGREMKHGGWNTDKMTILFRKDRYRYTVDIPHDHPVPDDENGFFQERLIHFSHRSIDEFLKKSNRYASGMAREYFRGGRKGTAKKIFFHPFYNFFKIYIFRLGILDGARGLISAVLSSAYVAEKYAKLWELDHRREIEEALPGRDEMGPARLKSLP